MKMRNVALATIAEVSYIFTNIWSVHLLTDWSSREWIGSFQLFSTAFGPCFSQLTSLKQDPCCGFLSLSPLYTLSNNSMLSCISTFLHPPVLQDLTWILEGFVRIPREGRLSSSLFMIYLIYLTLCSRLFVFNSAHMHCRLRNYTHSNAKRN